MKQILSEAIRGIATSDLIKHTTPFRVIKHFHPSRKKMPNGSHYQRGGFLSECLRNKNSFVIDEGVHKQQYGMSRYRGGIVVFSTDVNAVQMDDNRVLNKIKQLITTFYNRLNRGKKIHKVINKSNDTITDTEDRIDAYSVGNFFKGKYVGDNGEMYNEKSLCVEINGVSSLQLLIVAELLAQEFMQETVLVKDLNLNKIYIADDIPMPPETTIEDELSNINTKC